MFVPMIFRSREEIKRSVEIERQYEEEFDRNHPLLSILFDLIRGLAVCSFFGLWLIFMIYWIFFCG